MYQKATKESFDISTKKPHISALIGITACALITRRTENPDVCACPYYNKMKVYSGPRGFMTRSAFESLFKNSNFEYFKKKLAKKSEKPKNEL